jgi:hypothetical protein
MRKSIGLSLLLLGAVAPFSLTHADSMRCGGQIIEVGAKQGDVLQYCGDPTSKKVDEAAQRDGRYYDGTTATEHWTYTSGEVNTVVTFDQGVVVSIHTESAE